MQEHIQPLGLGRILDDVELAAFLDEAIRRERRLEALWRRASRGTLPEEVKERFQFEAYEDREHARILRRHRHDVVRRLPQGGRAPGARAAKIGRTLSPRSALREALELKDESRRACAAISGGIEDRYLRKFIEVLGEVQERAGAELAQVVEAHGLLRYDAPPPVHAPAPAGHATSAIPAWRIVAAPPSPHRGLELMAV